MNLSWPGKNRDDELEAEIRQHLDEATRDRIERGEAPEDARANAMREFGNVGLVKEVTREMWGGAWLDRLRQDLRFGLCMLRKNPGYTAVAVLSLALGIGANTAVFSIINAVLIRPLPFAEADRLVMIWETQPDVRGPVGSYLDFQDWRAQSQSFDSLAAFSNKRFGKAELTGRSETLEARGMLVSHDFFPTLGLDPVVGRNFLPEEQQPNLDRVVILSQSIWRRGFASDPGIVGKSIQLNAATFTVVGVVGGAQYPLDNDFWLPLSHLGSPDLTDRRYHSVQAIGRLRSGITVEQARTEIETITEHLRRLYPATNSKIGVELTPMRHHLAGSLRPTVLLAFAVVALVLLIACANVSNLLLAQSAGRQREMAIRSAIGAGRARLAKQLLVESLLLALLGGAAGLALAAFGIPLLRSALSKVVTGTIPGLDSIGIDWLTLAGAFGLSLLTGLLFGSLPALQVLRVDLNQTLKGGGKAATATGRRNVSRTLVAVQVALAVVVLVSAGLLIRSMSKLMRVDPGFHTDHLLSLKIELPRSRYPKADQVKSFYQQLTTRVEALPGVQRVGIIDRLPLAPSFRISRFAAEGQQPEQGREPITQMRMANHRFFETMGIRTLAGRVFDENDRVEDNRVIINETMALRFFQNQDPLGKRVFMHWGSGDPPAFTIIGVVGDIKDLGLEVPVEPTVYWPGVQGEAVLMARTSVDPRSLGSAVVQATQSIDPSLPITQARSLEEILDGSLARRRFTLNLLGVSALVALMLAAIGIYGVVSYSVTQRSQEIGIRMALGAKSSEVLKLIVGRGIIPVLIGVAMGLAGVIAFTRMLKHLTSDLLFDVQPTDPWTLAAIAILLITVALLACYVPARLGTKVNPLTVLRHD